MKFLQRIVGGLFVVASLGMISCSSELEVGSPEWCEAEKEQGKMDDYGMKEVLASGPLYKSKKLYKTYVDITFDYVGTGLNSKGILNGFEIAGSDNVFYPASAKIINKKVRVFSKKVKMPKRVRYGWKNYFDATLFNSEGLPASSFQTE